jgi:protein-histidine pros-kinase
MKSRLLAKQLQEIFGGEGEPRFRQLIEQARAGQQHGLADGIEKLIGIVDSTYRAYAGLNLSAWHSKLSGDVLADWNLRAGTIETGRQWKEMLGFAERDFDNSIDQWERMVHPDDLRLLQARIAAHVQSQDPFFRRNAASRRAMGSGAGFFCAGP